MSEAGHMTSEERRATLIAAVGGPEAYAAYVEASEALRRLAKHVPGSLGMDIADIYKGVTSTLSAALQFQQERRRR